MLGALAAGFSGPLVVVDTRDWHLKEPLTGRLSIMAPVSGTEAAPRATGIAIMLARASGCPLTGILVAPGGKRSGRAGMRRQSSSKWSR